MDTIATWRLRTKGPAAGPFGAGGVGLVVLDAAKLKCHGQWHNAATRLGSPKATHPSCSLAPFLLWSSLFSGASFATQ